MKKYLSFFLSMVLLCTFFPATVFAATTVASGYCGGDTKAEYDDASGYYKNLTWTLDSDGLLSISGEGEMANWDLATEDAPWSDYRHGIVTASISRGVTSINAEPFGLCENLICITVDADNAAFSSDSYGVLFNKTKTQLIQYPAGNPQTAYAIPAGVTEIFVGAFDGCMNLMNVTVPASVTSIGLMPFWGCESLTNIAVDANNNVFSNDSNGVMFNKDQTELIQYPGGRNGRYIIPSTVTRVVAGAFHFTRNLTSVIIPSSVTCIDDRSFEYCESMTDVYYTGSEAEWKLIKIGLGNEDLTDATIHYNYALTVVASGYCGGDTSAEFDEKSGCYKNLSWTLDSDGTLTISGTGVMAWKTSWEGHEDSIITVVIQPGVTSIGADAFGGCSNLKNVTIPEGLTSIGKSAFCNCRSLTSISIPSSVTNIDEEAFVYCFKLTDITVDANNTAFSSDSYGVLFNKAQTELIQYPVGNTRTSYTIPSSVTSIDAYAFYSCHLTSVTIPKGVTAIGDRAFSDCGGLTGFTVEEGNTKFSSDSDGVLFNKEKTELVIYPIGNERTTYTIPNGVTSIGNNAFEYCRLKSVTIPEGVLSVGNHGFWNCGRLTSVTIPSSVTDIGSNAFAVCYSLTEIIVAENNTKYSSKGGVLFNKEKTVLLQYPNGKTNATYLISKEGITQIGPDAFLGCHNLTSIRIPEGVTTISKGAFSQCDNLADVYYTGNQTEWGQIAIDVGNDPLLSAAIHYNHRGWLPNAVKYVPYSMQLFTDGEVISGDKVIGYDHCIIKEGALPDGLTLSETGEIFGIPTKKGTFTFTVSGGLVFEPLPNEQYVSGAAIDVSRGGVFLGRGYSIEVKDNSDNNVAEAPNVPEGYVIKEEVEDMQVTALSDQVFEIKSYSDELQTVEKENFGDFMEVYLDGRKLVGGKLIAPMTVETVPDNWEYYAEQGSTKITIRAQTFAKAGSGTHTIAAEFREGGVSTGELKTVAQNFKITSTSSGGGGGGSVSTTYKVTAPQTVGGKIAVTPENAKAGDTVALKVTPDVGYKLSEIAVGDVKLTKVDENTYTFTMPKNKVEIKAAFKKITSAHTIFADIDEMEWYYKAVSYVYENGLMCGVTEESFAPNEMMTRAMLLTVLSRYAGADLETTGQNWYVQSVEWAKANGISDGLNPEENITREQVATMLYRYANEPEMVADLSVFGDENSVSSYAVKAMQWAVANGLINGMDGKLAPQAFATRTQLAAIIMRYCENVAK